MSGRDDTGELTDADVEAVRAALRKTELVIDGETRTMLPDRRWVPCWAFEEASSLIPGSIMVYAVAAALAQARMRGRAEVTGEVTG